MNEQFNQPKGFGEILDQTFRLSKNRFSDFILILLILIGPIYLLQALVQLFSGTSFIREVGTGGTWIDQVISSFDPAVEPESYNLGADLGMGLLGLVSLILIPIAQVAILFAVNHIRKNESYTVSSVIKEAFAKFWPVTGSSLLLVMITFGMFFVSLIIILIIGFGVGAVDPFMGIITGILLFLGIGLLMALLLTRLSFYLGVVALENDAPGITRSWKLTKKRTWILFGLYLIFSLIVAAISSAVEVPIMFLLGNSVLYTIIINVVSLFTMMIFAVGYAVIFFDLKVRHDADDLKEIIDDYQRI